MRTVKLIYWDFDGVIRPDRTGPGATRDGFDPDCVGRAHRVHAATGALAVVSSTWRRDQRCRQIMADNGFDPPLFDALWATPLHLDHGGDRSDDIDCHMAQCLRMGYRVTGFAMVDDLYGPLPPHQVGHLVGTDPKTGVSDLDCDAIIRALGVPVSQDCYA